MEIFAIIFSAIIHDCDHPAYNNNFLITTSHSIALKHNDSSPLENHHCAMGFLCARKFDLFANLSKAE